MKTFSQGCALLSGNEMARGERFVEDVLRAKARRRERWIVGLPAAALALVGLWLMLWRRRRHALSVS
jgi:hypothetical protein